MHPWLGHCYPSYDPCMPYPAWGSCGWLGPGAPGAAVSFVPIVCVAMPIAWAAPPSRLTVPHELALQPGDAAATAMVGGSGRVGLSLEYLVEAGAAAPQVKLTVVSAGATTTWEETGIAQGYHVKDDFAALEPGAKVTLEVVDAAARLRWCETICC